MAATDPPPAKLPPAELPPAELPPAELPPAELPPAELPPAELPPAELPPAEPEKNKARPGSGRRLAQAVRKYLLLFAALLVFGGVMGFFVGITSSEIAATFIPLAFGFLATGGFLVSFFKKREEAPVSEADRRAWVTFIAVQASGFALGLLGGFWAGVWGKFQPETFWPAGEPATAYTQLPFTSIRDMEAARNVERMLAADGIPPTQRLEILRKLFGKDPATPEVAGGDTPPGEGAADEPAVGSPEPNIPSRLEKNLPPRRFQPVLSHQMPGTLLNLATPTQVKSDPPTPITTPGDAMTSGVVMELLELKGTVETMKQREKDLINALNESFSAVASEVNTLKSELRGATKSELRSGTPQDAPPSASPAAK